MAKKISELPVLTDPLPDDLLTIADIDDNESKSIKVATLMSKAVDGVVAGTPQISPTAFDINLPEGSGHWVTTSTTPVVLDGSEISYTAGDTDEKLLLTCSILLRNNTDRRASFVAVNYGEFGVSGTELKPNFYTDTMRWHRQTMYFLIDVLANQTVDFWLTMHVSSDGQAECGYVNEHQPRWTGLAIHG